MIVLDASVLIAHLGVGDPHAGRAFEILDRDETFVVHPLTLGEVLVGAVRDGIADEVCELLEVIGVQEGDGSEVTARQLAELRAESRLKMPDCVVLGLAIHHGAALATFDAQLAAAGRSRGVRVID